MKRLAVYTLGFLQVPYVRRILRSAGWKLVIGPLAWKADAVGVWGRKRRARRGIDAAKRRNLPVLNIEDAFLRSVNPGVWTAPAGFVLDELGIYFDAGTPSGLENMLATAPLDDPDLLARAEAGIRFLRENGLSKYNPVGRDATRAPDPGYVLIIDQTRGDASLEYGRANDETFKQMLASARLDFPDAPIIIRTHPAVVNGLKTGHYGAADLDGRTTLLDSQINPWDLLSNARAVYCATSQMGFEAILAGHRPVVFGVPFYAGWGLSEDRQPVARRGRTLDKTQLFAAAMLEYPFWFNPYKNRVGRFESAASALLARSRHVWANRQPSVALGMKSWKRPRVSLFLQSDKHRPVFIEQPQKAVQRAKAKSARVVVWASKETPELATACAQHQVPLWRMEDGFLRSSGLGAELVPAASVVMDDLGIYFDPTRASRLERLIAESGDLPADALERAERLRQSVIAAGITKYNLKSAPQPLTGVDGRRVILVPGQVEDDASIRLGTTDIRTNADLLRVARERNPEAFIIYKPHPDVEKGLRVGKIDRAGDYADLVAVDRDAAQLLDQVDAVWTMTSLMGFEALLRGVAVTCLGMPFYAGWGLTDDQGQVCARRSARPELAGMVHACLIDYPLYLDPVTKIPCPVEVLVERLGEGAAGRGVGLTMLAKLQGRFAGYAHLWR